MRRISALIVFLTAIASLFAFLANPFCGVPGCDSSIFIYVARRMMAGQVPYMDVFDQKGLLIYVLDAIGWSCGGVWGIWALDVLSFALGTFLVACIVRVGKWKTGQTYFPLLESVMALAVWVVMYHAVACGGNMPEMWIIVFSALGYWLSVKVENRSDLLSTFAIWALMGFCVALILMLKLNMIAVVAPMALVWFGKLDDWKVKSTAGRKVRILAAWMAGLVLGLLPFAIYLTSKGGWAALWEVYVCYNAQYAAHGGWMPSVSRAFAPVAILWCVNLWMALRSRERLAWLNLSYLTAAWGLVLLSGGSVRYYGPVLPTCIVPIGWVCRWVVRVSAARRELRALPALLVVGCAVAICGLVYVRNRGAEGVRAQYAELEALRGRIQDRQSVTVLGCDCHVYQVLDVECPCRFPFQGTIAKCSEMYRLQMIEDLEKGMSKYVILPVETAKHADTFGIAWARDPIRCHYRLVATTSHYNLYELQAKIHPESGKQV